MNRINWFTKSEPRWVREALKPHATLLETGDANIDEQWQRICAAQTGDKTMVVSSLIGYRIINGFTSANRPIWIRARALVMMLLPSAEYRPFRWSGGDLDTKNQRYVADEIVRLPWNEIDQRVVDLTADLALAALLNMQFRVHKMDQPDRCKSNYTKILIDLMHLCDQGKRGQILNAIELANTPFLERILRSDDIPDATKVLADARHQQTFVLLVTSGASRRWAETAARHYIDLVLRFGSRSEDELLPYSFELFTKQLKRARELALFLDHRGYINVVDRLEQGLFPTKK